MPSALKGVDYDAIRMIYVSGQESLSSMAERFNIPLKTLKAQANRKGWTTARKDCMQALKTASTRKKIEPQEKEMQPIAIPESKKEVHPDEQAPKSLEFNVVNETALEQWPEKQLKTREIAWKKGHKGLADAELPAPRSWKDLDIADRVARRAAGLDDSDGVKVNVLINLQILNGSVKQRP